MVKVPRPEASAKKPGMAARAMVEYFILATSLFHAISKNVSDLGYIDG